MTLKHTPGPWSANYNPKTESWEVTEPYDGLHCPVMFEGSESDARLIAKAPDLLQAVKDALEVISGFENYKQWRDADPALNTIRKQAYKTTHLIKRILCEIEGADPK